MITLQFIGAEGFRSRLIGWFSAGHLSHVDVVMFDGQLLGARSDTCKCELVGRTIEIPPGVRIRPPNYIGHPRSLVRFDIPATVEQERIFFAFLIKQIGRPYDYEAIMGFIFNRDWRETDSWICSELVAAALERAKIVPELYLAANRITPVSAALAVSVLSTGLAVSRQHSP
jgi:hypothetical protein